LTGAVAFLHVDGEPEVDVLGLQLNWLAVDHVISGVHLWHCLQRLHDGVADEVSVRDLPTAGAGQVVVDDDALIDQQLDRHRSHAGGRRDGQAVVHVLDRARRGSPKPVAGRLRPLA
jgi:hypothetical protein